MSLNTIQSRRRFLRQSFAFSAAAAFAGPLAGCGHGVGNAISTALNSTSNRINPVSHMLMLGDWGADGDFSEQTSVSKGMQSYIKGAGITPQALAMLGDNFYGPFTGGVASNRWQTQFEQMYPKSVFDCPAYAIPGNHDYTIDPDPKYPIQLAYAAQKASRWQMPSQWYSFTFPQANPVVTIIALDSNVPFANGATQIGQFYTMTPGQQADQLVWLKAELEKPLKTPFLAVMAHHPIYSDGPHGDHPVLIRDWDALLKKYKVHLYLAGHDHDLQHLEFADHPTSFFLSGGGGADLYTLTIDPATRGPWAQRIHGFSHLEATSDLLTLRHLDGGGNVIHAFSKAPDGSVKLLI